MIKGGALKLNLTPKKSKKIRVGDEFYVDPDMVLDEKSVFRGLENGTTLKVRAIISLKHVTVDVIFAENEGAVSNTIVVPSAKLKNFPRERRGSNTMYHLSDKRVDELTNCDAQPTPVRESDKPDFVRALMLQAFHKRLERAGLQFVN